MDDKAKKLRREGYVTGNVFGRSLAESIPVKIEKKEAERFLSVCNKGSEAKLTIDTTDYDVLVKEVDYDPIKRQTLEIDFQVLTEGEKVHSVAEIVLVNHDKVQGVVEQHMEEIPYKAAKSALVEKVSVDIGELKPGDSIKVSTDYVFDGTAHIPYTEECDPCPNSVYGTTKLEGEYEVLNHCEKSVVIRTAWLYSTFGNNFVKTMIRLGKERDSLGVIFDQVGTPTYANDLAQAIFAIINKGIVRGVYHFSNEGVCSWYDFTVAIHRLAGITSCKVKPLHTAEYPTRANRPAYSVLDKTKIKTTFGIEIPHWEESLKRCIDTL